MKHRWYIIGICALGLLSSGCAKGPVRDISQNRITGAWSKNFSKKNISMSELVLDQHALYWGSTNGYVFRVSAVTLKKTWASYVRDGVTTPPLVFENRVYVGTQKGHILCLDAQSGKILWSTKMETSVRGKLTPYKGLIFMVGLDGQVIGVDQDNGNVEFQQRFFVSESFTLAYEMLPAKTQDSIIVALPNLEILSLDQNLVVKWQQNYQSLTTNNLIQAIVSVDEISNQRFLITPYLANPFVLDRDGNLVTTLTAITTASQPRIEGNTAIYATQNGIYKVNLTSLSISEELPYKNAYPITSVHRLEYLLFVGTSNGGLDVYDLQEQEKLWTYITDAPIKGTPVVYRGNILMLNQRGQIFAFRKPYQDGQGAWINP